MSELSLNKIPSQVQKKQKQKQKQAVSMCEALEESQWRAYMPLGVHLLTLVRY